MCAIMAETPMDIEKKNLGYRLVRHICVGLEDSPKQFSPVVRKPSKPGASDHSTRSDFVDFQWFIDVPNSHWLVDQ